MTLKHLLKKITAVLKDYFYIINFILIMCAIGIGFYNTSQIKNLTTIPKVNNVVESSELLKLIDELPANTPFLGNPNSKITVIEFADYQCPFCLRFFNSTFPLLKQKYIDTNKIKFIYVDLAFLGPESKDAASASHCAEDQGKFWQYHDELFNNQKSENRGDFSKENLILFAQKLNLNISTFKSCLETNKYEKLVNDSLALGRRYSLSATPIFIIGKDKITGAGDISTFDSILESQI